MKRVLSVESERFPIAGTFTIARGSKTEAEVVTCRIMEAGITGMGECVPYRRYGESVDSVIGAIEAACTAVEGGADRSALLTIMPAGAARNAVDCALWDLEAKIAGKSVADLSGLPALRPVTTAFTLSLDTPEKMARQASLNAHRPLLKVKLGSTGDPDRMRAVAQAAPASLIILDANEGWTPESVADNFALAAELGIALIEQPLPAGQDEMLRDLTHTVPICADESLQTIADLPRLAGLYDAINIKLDKTGGLTEALDLSAQARALGFQIMVGCMVGTSLGMAPALLVAQDAEFVDLDGPLLLARDREPGLVYRGSIIEPPPRLLWG